MWGLYLSAFWAQTCQEKLLNCCPRTHISLASQLSAWNAQDLERQPHENSIKVLRELVLAGSLIVEPWGRGEWWGLGQAFFLWIILALFSRKIAVLNLGNPSVSVGELRENPDAWIHTPRESDLWDLVRGLSRGICQSPRWSPCPVSIADCLSPGRHDCDGQLRWEAEVKCFRTVCHA